MARKDIKEEAKHAKKSVKEELEDYIEEESQDSDNYEPPGKSSPKGAKARRAVRERPKKRCLIRWNEIYDQRTLLAVQHVMSKKGMKIPWDEVGAELGPTITEGAIVQHLAKLRNRLADEGVQVTPPLKRGGRMNSSTPSSKAGNNNKTVSAKGGVAKRTGTGKSQKQVKKGRITQEDDEEEENEQDDVAPRHGKGKSYFQQQKRDFKRKPTQTNVKIELSSDDDLKNRGQSNKMDRGRDMGDISSEDGIHESDYGYEDEGKAVAVGAPFLAQESDISSEAATVVSTLSPHHIVTLKYPRDRAEAIQYPHGSDDRSHHQDVGHGRGSEQEGYATAQGSQSDRGSYTSHVHTPARAGYGSDHIPVTRHENLYSSSPVTTKREKTTPTNQSTFAGHGMPFGPFEQNTPFGRSGHGSPVHYPGYSDVDGFGLPTNVTGYSNIAGYGSSYAPGFPMSNERQLSCSAVAPGNQSSYLHHVAKIEPQKFNSPKTPSAYNAGPRPGDASSYHDQGGASIAGPLQRHPPGQGYSHHANQRVQQASAGSNPPIETYSSEGDFHPGNQAGEMFGNDEIDFITNLNDDRIFDYFDDSAGGINHGY